MDRRFILGLPLAGLALLAACTEPAPLDPLAAPAFAVGDPPEEGYYQLCKVGTAADFNVWVNGTPQSPTHLDAGHCTYIVSGPTVGDHVVTVTEVSDPSTNLVQIEERTQNFRPDGQLGQRTLTNTNQITTTIDGDIGAIVTFTNEAVEPALGRMTGGGNPKVAGVNFGLTLHCDITLSNNLEINWDGGNWHLDKPITYALCTDDPNVNPVPPAAGFDTFYGEATGRLDGVDGSIVKFTFVDAGEPGKNDWVEIQIWAPNAAPTPGTEVLNVSGKLTHGNLQAHHDQPHGDHG